MRRLFGALPGPLPVRVVISAALIVIAAISLHFIYMWMGNALLDTGGGVG